MGRMKEFGLWLLKLKNLSDENIYRLARKEPWNIDDGDWLREQIALLRSGELAKLMGVSDDVISN